MSERYSHYLGGGWETPGETANFLPNRNPARLSEVLGEFQNGTSEDATKAIEAAHKALAGWAALPAPSRGEFLRKAADLLAARVDHVAKDLMLEEGKSLPEAKGETMRGVAILRYYAAQTLLPDGEVIPSATAGILFFTRRIPVGVCALITPWNFPIAIPLWKAAPALAFGNTVVMKPSEHSPLTAHHLAEVFHEAGLPAGVFNVLYGEGARVGETLTTHPAVNALSFTGSAKTGKWLGSQCSANGKKYQLEMGGKNAVIVLPDADLEQAVNLTVQGAFKSAGQKCTATSRAIIHEDVYQSFVNHLVEKVHTLKVGAGDEADAYLGPVISEAARDNILKAIREAAEAGSTLLCGGKPLEGAKYDLGAYVPPTVFWDVDPDAKIAKEEVFGPVLCLFRAKSEEEALEILNSSEYGLSASIFTKSLNSALRFAEKAQVGMVRVNGETAGVEPQAPFGGMKGSSSYSREQGMAARDFYTQIKTIAIEAAAE